MLKIQLIFPFGKKLLKTRLNEDKIENYVKNAEKTGNKDNKMQSQS